jgi:hypothetical protein
LAKLFRPSLGVYGRQAASQAAILHHFILLLHL